MRLSPSSMARAIACQYWLREDVPVVESESSSAADIGTQTHARIERQCSDRDVAIVPCPEADELYEVWCADAASEYVTDRARYEVCLAWDPRTGAVRELGDGISREERTAMLAPNEMGMSIDYVDPGRRLVADWKTGQQTHLQPASRNAQLAIYATALSKLFAWPDATVRTVHITTEGVFTDSHTLDAFDMLDVAANVCAVLDTEDAQPKPGDHCRWCPAKAAGCPGPAGVTAAMVSQQPIRLPIASAAQAAEYWERLQVAEDMLAACKRAVQSFVSDHGEITLSSGKRLVACTETRESIVVDGEALRVLSEHGAEVAIERSITKAAIERAMGGKKASIPVLEDLRAAGCVRAKEIITYRERGEK